MNYEEEVIKLEAKCDDVNTTRIPLHELYQIAKLCREIDILKRRCFYDKKPDRDKIKVIRNEIKDLFDIVWPWENKFTNDPSFDNTKINHRILHSILGIITETGEILENLLDAIANDRDVNYDNLLEEQSDLFWYQALMRDECIKLHGDRFTRENIEKANIAKLKVRYSKGTEYGQERDVEKEKKAIRESTYEVIK